MGLFFCIIIPVPFSAPPRHSVRIGSRPSLRTGQGCMRPVRPRAARFCGHDFFGRGPCGHDLCGHDFFRSRVCRPRSGSGSGGIGRAKGEQGTERERGRGKRSEREDRGGGEGTVTSNFHRENLILDCQIPKIFSAMQAIFIRKIPYLTDKSQKFSRRCK